MKSITEDSMSNDIENNSNHKKDFTDDPEWIEYCKKNKILKCPKCKVWIQHRGGCIKMRFACVCCVSMCAPFMCSKIVLFYFVSALGIENTKKN